MSEIAERYRRVAGRFTETAEAVPPSAWDNPAPCEGWLARDVVRHLVEWVPSFFTTYAGIELGAMPSVDENPALAWSVLDAALSAALDDPSVAAKQFEMQGQTHTVETAIAMFCIGDVLVHTWDLARATGLDETLDPIEVHRMVEAMEPMDELLRNSGHYGPRVAVPDDADEQKKLIAFTGRQP